MRFVLPLIVCLSSLSACGFEPMHAQHTRDIASPSLALLNQIEIDAPKTREGQLFTAELDDLLNPSHSATPKEYRLTVSLESSEEDLVVLEDATASRKRVLLHSMYYLTRIADGNIVDSGKVTYSNSYIAQDDANYAAYTVERDIRQRALTELAERYKTRLAGIFANFDDV